MVCWCLTHRKSTVLLITLLHRHLLHTKSPSRQYSGRNLHKITKGNKKKWLVWYLMSLKTVLLKSKIRTWSWHLGSVSQQSYQCCQTVRGVAQCCFNNIPYLPSHSSNASGQAATGIVCIEYGKVVRQQLFGRKVKVNEVHADKGCRDSGCKLLLNDFAAEKLKWFTYRIQKYTSI